MKIRDEHLYHGAALTQIAEHPQFTAINGVRTNGALHRSAFRVNDSIGIYLKYASKPTPTHKAYVFTFTQEHIEDLVSLTITFPTLYLGLVCVKDGEICALSYSNLSVMIEERRKLITGEDSYTVLVTAREGKSLRAYMNRPGKKGVTLKQRTISRNAFPEILFK